MPYRVGDSLHQICEIKKVLRMLVTSARGLSEHSTLLETEGANYPFFFLEFDTRR